MPKGRKRAASEAVAVERAMKRIDRGVARYGATAMAKYYSPSSSFRPEVKYFDCMFDADQSVTASTPAALPMTSYMAADGSTVTAYTDAAIIPSAIGNGYGQVIGNKYLIKKVKVRGTISRPTTAGAEPSAVARVLLLQDTQPNGAQVLGNTIFTDWGDGPQSQNSFQSISSGTGGRIRILADRFITIEATDSNAATSASYQTKMFNFSKSWKKGLKTVVKSGSATPTVASLSDNNIFLLVGVFSQGTQTASSFNVYGCTRCSYVD